MVWFLYLKTSAHISIYTDGSYHRHQRKMRNHGLIITTLNSQRTAIKSWLHALFSLVHLFQHHVTVGAGDLPVSAPVTLVDHLDRRPPAAAGDRAPLEDDDVSLHEQPPEPGCGRRPRRRSRGWAAPWLRLS